MVPRAMGARLLGAQSSRPAGRDGTADASMGPPNDRVRVDAHPADCLRWVIQMSEDVSRRAVLRAGALALGALAMPGNARGGELLERRIARSNESLPAVGLGTWQVFDVAGDAVGLGQARDTLRAFADGGGRVVD